MHQTNQTVQWDSKSGCILKTLKNTVLWNVQDNLNNFQQTIREKNVKTQKPYRWEIKLKILIKKNKKDILEENDIKVWRL